MILATDFGAGVAVVNVLLFVGAILLFAALAIVGTSLWMKVAHDKFPLRK